MTQLNRRYVYWPSRGGNTGTFTIKGGATSTGFLNAASVNGGDGSASLGLKHTESDYHFTTTRRLAVMKLANRGIEANIGKKHADTFRQVQHPDRFPPSTLFPATHLTQ